MVPAPRLASSVHVRRRGCASCCARYMRLLLCLPGLASRGATEGVQLKGCNRARSPPPLRPQMTGIHSNRCLRLRSTYSESWMRSRAAAYACLSSTISARCWLNNCLRAHFCWCPCWCRSSIQYSSISFKESGPFPIPVHCCSMPEMSLAWAPDPRHGWAGGGGASNVLIITAGDR